MAPGAGFEPARAPWPTGSQGQVTIERSTERLKKLPPDHAPFKYLPDTNIQWGTVVKIVIQGDRVILEFNSTDDVHKFITFLQSLGVTSNVEKREIRIEYDLRFWDYLVKDRQLDIKTTRSYMNYLRKLDGEVINYDLYLRILNNKWKVKTVRLFLDYLYKTGRIGWEELQKLKSIFKVKRNSNGGDEYPLDVYDLIDKYSMVNNDTLYRLLLEILLYSGTRLSEAVKMIREWNDEKLECFEEFCRYRLKWYRGRKRCDYIYFPKHLLPKILQHVYKIGKYDNVRKKIYDYYGIRPKEFRKLHYRLCRKILDKEICAFYQSRSSRLDVSDIHYDQLRTRADENYSKLIRYIDSFVDRIKEELYLGRPVEVIKVIRIEDDILEKTKDEYMYHVDFTEI